MSRPFISLLLPFSFVLVIVSSARAGWVPNGTPVVISTIGQNEPVMVGDGFGGAIVAWTDFRNSATVSDVFAQRINANGTPLWTNDGVTICAVVDNQVDAVIASDGAGGAIIAWADPRAGTGFTDIYAQRVNSSGIPQWTPNGVPICVAVSTQSLPKIVADGSGGAIITWQDFRSGTSYDIYAQRVNGSGIVQWTGNGIAVCALPSSQENPRVAAAASGAVFTWQDFRSGTSWDIYAQALNSSGTPLWAPNGVPLCTAAGNQINPEMVSDNASGPIVVWVDLRSGATSDIYARRVNAAGTVLWNFDGVALCTAANDQEVPQIVSDGSAGAIVTWMDERAGSLNLDIYARRVNSSGVAIWTYNGVPVCTQPLHQLYPTIVADGSGGAVIVWDDGRTPANVTDLYTQHLNSFGMSQWTTDGVAVSTAPGTQDSPVIVSDGLRASIVMWLDFRGSDTDIYAQRIENRYGQWGTPEPVIASVADISGDQGGKVKVDWTASGLDLLNYQTITHYSIWRATDEVDFVVNTASVVDDPSQIGPDFEGHAYWKHPTEDYYFEWVANQKAMYLQAYTYSADTRADQTPLEIAEHFFMVFAHTDDDFTFWPSNVVSGFSVDNLAPAAPLALTAQRVGPDVLLRWNRVAVPDLRDYAVYRASSPGVTPVPINFLASADDTVLTDAGAPPTSLHYIVTASDIHENQSAPSNEASVSPSTNVGSRPPVATLTLLQNYPNPFAGTTQIEIGLPSRADVSLEVFDVAGARVRTQTLARRDAGWQRVPFDGRNDAGHLLPSGVYFCRVTANGSTVARKMVIAR